MIRTLPFALLVLALASCGPATPTPAPLDFKYVPAASDAEPGRFEVRGLPPDALAKLTDPELQKAVLSVGTGPDARLMGTHGIDGDLFWFRPRFPLTFDVQHTGILDPEPIHLADSTRFVVVTPRRPPTPPAEVVAVYPSGDAITENVLRFYLHFSQPMRRGEAYQRVRVRDPKGQPIDLPFLELDEELWDPTGTRLTLLIDPGRIKRGVKPREDIGTVFTAGGRYTLEVDAGWPDAQGRPLKTGFTKAYIVTAPAADRIDPVGWTVVPPTAPDAPLIVRFPAPLDRGLLDGMLTVHKVTGDESTGRIEVTNVERTWRFIAARPWSTGTYQLRVGVTLEDPAGNRPDRLFDTPETAPTNPTPPVLVRSFEVIFGP